MSTAVVVGGGIAGILSSILLKRKFEDVYIIEKNNQIGGLLKSFRNNEGIEFDCGTHFLRDTGHTELDALLFKEKLMDDWLVLDYLKVGNFFGGKLNDHSPFVDSTCLSEELYQKGMMELLSLGSLKTDYKNVEDQFYNLYGVIFTNYIFKPALQKFFGQELHEIVPNAHSLFIPSRLLGFNPETTRELKKSPVFDSKLGFHSYKDGLSNCKNYYPKCRGIGLWIENLTETLHENGVKIIAGSSVNKIKGSNQCIDSVVLDNGTQLNCNQLVWTVPPFLFIKACGLMSPIQFSPPARIFSGLHHFVFDKPFLTDLYYLSCYDPDFISFRVTLYPNVQQPKKSQGKYHLTVEVLSQGVPDLERDSQTVFYELQKMKIITNTSKVLARDSEVVSGGFPIPTQKFVKGSQAQLELAKKQFNNSLFLGKNTGNSWFLNEVLVDTYHSITELLGA